jgi:hypothetical protein
MVNVVWWYQLSHQQNRWTSWKWCWWERAITCKCMSWFFVGPTGNHVCEALIQCRSLEMVVPGLQKVVHSNWSLSLCPPISWSTGYPSYCGHLIINKKLLPLQTVAPSSPCLAHMQHWWQHLWTTCTCWDICYLSTRGYDEVSLFA